MPTDKDETEFDSFQFCIDFWEGAIDVEDEIDHFVRELPARTDDIE
jgi:hypothetical protein